MLVLLWFRVDASARRCYTNHGAGRFPAHRRSARARLRPLPENPASAVGPSGFPYEPGRRTGLEAVDRGGGLPPRSMPPTCRLAQVLHPGPAPGAPVADVGEAARALVGALNRRAFGITAWDADGRYAAGVGVKRHNRHKPRRMILHACLQEA